MAFVREAKELIQTYRSKTLLDGLQSIGKTLKEDEILYCPYLSYYPLNLTGMQCALNHHLALYGDESLNDKTLRISILHTQPKSFSLMIKGERKRATQYPVLCEILLSCNEKETLQSFVFLPCNKLNELSFLCAQVTENKPTTTSTLTPTQGLSFMNNILRPQPQATMLSPPPPKTPPPLTSHLSRSKQENLKKLADCIVMCHYKTLRDDIFDSLYNSDIFAEDANIPNIIQTIQTVLDSKHAVTQVDLRTKIEKMLSVCTKKRSRSRSRSPPSPRSPSKEGSCSSPY